MDLLIVAPEDDALAVRLFDAARARGRKPRHVGMLEAGQRVTPACPMFLRPAFPRELDREARLHHQEAYASVWAAARQAEVPVINRPAEWGTPGHYSYIRTITQRPSEPPYAEPAPPPCRTICDHVAVVGDTAWRSIDLPVDGVDIEARSIEASRWLGLAFCVCTWAVTGDTAHITRIDAFPTMQQVQLNWSAVSVALLESLA